MNSSTSQVTGTYELGHDPDADKACAAMLQRLLAGRRFVITEQFGIDRSPFTRGSGDTWVIIAPAVNSPSGAQYLKFRTTPILAVPVDPVEHGRDTYRVTVIVRKGEIEIQWPKVVNHRLRYHYYRIEIAQEAS